MQHMDTDMALTTTLAVDKIHTQPAAVVGRPNRPQKRLAAGCAPVDGGPAEVASPSPQRERRVVSAEAVAAARALKSAQAAQVERMVDQQMAQLYRETYQVSWLHVEVAGSLPAASALYAIERSSTQANLTSGSPWVALSLQDWLHHTGLDRDQWLHARETLRGLGLIHERRSFDPAEGEIGTEIAFDAGMFELEIALLHAALRQVAWDALKRSMPI